MYCPKQIMSATATVVVLLLCINRKLYHRLFIQPKPILHYVSQVYQKNTSWVGWTITPNVRCALCFVCRSQKTQRRNNAQTRDASSPVENHINYGWEKRSMFYYIVFGAGHHRMMLVSVKNDVRLKSMNVVYELARRELRKSCIIPHRECLMLMSPEPAFT